MDTENTNVLDSPATPQNLRALAKRGVLASSDLERALTQIGHLPDRARWTRFLDWVLLVLGAGFFISGVFFFFAFNWQALHRFAKLGVLELGVVLAVGIAFWQTLERLPGKIALTAAALLVGALFAVYGQIYQTGADSYQLFLTWALLIAVWVFIGKFTPLWFVLLVLLNLTVSLYWFQVVGANNSFINVLLFLVNGAALVAWELFRRVGVNWLTSRWTPRLIALEIFVLLVAPTLALIFISEYAPNNDIWLRVLAGTFVVVSVATLYVYSQRVLDQFMLIVCSFSLIVTLVALVLKTGNFGTGVIFLSGALVIGLAALVVVWLRRLSEKVEVQQT